MIESLYSLSSRFKVMLLSICLAFIGIISYLFHLQINQMQLFFAQGQRNFTRPEIVASPRGTIVDSKNRVLVSNQPVYTLYWQGTGNQIFSKAQEDLLKIFTENFSLSQAIIARIKHCEKRSTRMKLFSDVSFAQLALVVEHTSQDKNIIFEKTYKRCYPHNKLACHIIGYIGLDSNAPGKIGLELICNKALKGKAGKTINIINAVGRNLQAHAVNPALTGETLQTTLDLDLQKAMEDVFPRGYKGSAILMDEDGALEVVLSSPAFDPSIFLKPVETTQWKKLQESEGFLNRAFSGCYPPASLFKLVTLAAALETGLIQDTMSWHCIGHTTFKGRRYHCHRRKGHGIVSTEEALAYSCNIPFYEIGKKIKIDTLAAYANQFGLGMKTGILFPENTGLIPTVAWKKRIKGERWWPGETLSATIGQSAMLTTPLQIACMLSSLCTGYRSRPRILLNEVAYREPLDIKETTLSFLQTCLESVVKKGTGLSLSKLHNFTIKGKSGTAQVRALGKKALCKEHLPHGYMALHFQYKDKRPKTLVIFIEHAGSSSVATSCVQRFLKKYETIIDKRK